MSLAINIDAVSAVLLADGWHEVAPMHATGPFISSFDIDTFEFVDGAGHIALAGGAEPLIPSRGFAFREHDGGRVVGPLHAILALR